MRRLLPCLVLSALLSGAAAARSDVLQITSPTPGQRLQQLQTVPVVVRAQQTIATRTISLSVDGGVVQTLDTPAPWTDLRLSWDVGERRPGTYSLRVSTVSTAGAKWSSPTVKVVVEEAPWYPAPRTRSYALLVGVGHYQDNGITALTYSGADVKALYRVLTDPALGAYPAENVVMLTDESPADRQPTRSIVLGQLKNWLGAVGKDADSVLFYFSGHGIEEDGKGYLVPKDAQPGLLSDTGIDLERVNQLLAGTNARVKILMLDACHSAARKSVKVQMPSGFARELFTAGEGRVTLASCKEDQRSWEWPEKGQSVFTQYLVEALQGRADANRDRRVTLDEAYRYVHRQVTRWAAERRREQEPRLKADISGEVVLTGMTPGEKPVRRPGVVTAAPPAREAGDAAGHAAAGAGGATGPSAIGRDPGPGLGEPQGRHGVRLRARRPVHHGRRG